MKNLKVLKKILDFYPNYHFSLKKSKKLTNKQLSEALTFPLKKPKKLKKISNTKKYITIL